MFDVYLARWNLVPDGPPIVTHSSRLLPVRYRGEPAILKMAVEAEEKWGGLLMLWWHGEGAARVLACDENVLLLERAEDTGALIAMAHGGQDKDGEASRIICGVAARLHAPRTTAPPELFPLKEWFGYLETAAGKYGGIFVRASVTARELLDHPREVVPLHGDLHHGNVLDFGPRGWLAIDPKHLIGERGFDFVNIFCNRFEVATAPGRLAEQVRAVAEAARLDQQRLLQWILAWSGLLASWTLNDGDATLPLTVAELAAAELGAPG